jgi:hypothetical protein
MMAKFTLELWLDGYDSEEEMIEACKVFIYEQLNMTASGVSNIQCINKATIDLIADWECGEGSIELTEDFLSESKMMQVDLLQDWVSELTDVCNQSCLDLRGEFDDIRNTRT